jgi:hypothetical protein
MTAKDLRRILRSHGCVECGTCVTTVPAHAGEDI